MTSKAGQNFKEKFTLGDKIGEGAYSVVKKATENATGTTVAVKIMDRKKLKSTEITEIKGEISVLSEVDHPNCLKLYGFYEDESSYYIVTEFLAGGELFDRIVAKEYYSEQDAQGVIRVLCSALKYLHDKGIVHRDMKPENIILTSKDEDAAMKIADFGFAKRTKEGGLTTSLGTPGYVAPEILQQKPYGTSVDMWALGVILYILLCGYPPFYDEHQPTLFKKIMAAQYKFDEPYWNSVSASAKDLIQNLLVVDPKKRYTVDDVLKHHWVADECEEKKDITPAIDELRQYLNRRRLKAGIHGVLALTRIRNVGGKLSTILSVGTEMSDASSSATDSLNSSEKRIAASAVTAFSSAPKKP